MELYLKVKPKIDALQDASTHTEMDTRMCVCASTVRERICEFIFEAQSDTTKLRGIHKLNFHKNPICRVFSDGRHILYYYSNTILYH